MEITGRVKGLYTDMYAGGVERAWRDVGAIDKGGNIARLWREAGLPASPRVVEIGCGEGAIGAALQDLNFFGDYLGFDFSESGIAEAESREVPGATFAVNSGDGVPVADDGADLVVLSHVVEHLEHPRTLLHEAARIAEYTVVEVPLELHSRTPRDYVFDDLGHINKYTATSIRHLLQSCGFEVLGQITTNPSRSVALFNDGSLKRRLMWQVKERLLKVSQPLARSLFTYHETLLVRRGEPSPEATPGGPGGGSSPH
jgi:ubiquinone/menaquinone biosynthesis C-methylase UbiE